MAFSECYNNVPSCPFQPRCASNEHHTYYPSTEYTTPIENRFRNLGANLVQLCMYEHVQEHRYDPPEKPSKEEMIRAIEESGEHISRSVRKAIKEHRNGKE